jgi:hypothetical protein
VVQVVIVYREPADRADAMKSAETSYYITSARKDKAGAELLGGHTCGHWPIENKTHRAREWAHDEDRHQLSSTTTARALATLRNLAISIFRRAGAHSITVTLRWVARDAERAAALGCVTTSARRWARGTAGSAGSFWHPTPRHETNVTGRAGSSSPRLDPRAPEHLFAVSRRNHSRKALRIAVEAGVPSAGLEPAHPAPEAGTGPFRECPLDLGSYRISWSSPTYR